jgi:translation initiation factor 4E
MELNDTWCLYFHAKNSKKNYSQNTTKLVEINNIIDFWGTFNNIPIPTDMFSEPNALNKIVKNTREVPGALSLFRKNSYPTWEHDTNIKGFEWSIRKYKDIYDINQLWMNIIIEIVGENFDHSEILNGVRIVDSTIENKIMYRLEIWFTDKTYKDYFETKIKTIFNIPYYTKLLYREHSTLKENKPNKTITV